MGSYATFRTFITAVAFILVPATAGAQTLDNFYVNAFTLEADGSQGGYEFGFGWGDADKLRITQNGDFISFKPNISLCAEDAGWCDGDNALGGNWFIHASAFSETAIAPGDDAQNFEFKGCFTADSTTQYHTLEAFMQVLDPNNGYAIYAGTTQTETAGCWDFSHSETGANAAVVQFGLRMLGQNVDPANDAEAGEVTARLGVPVGNAQPDADAIPTVPIGGLLVLIGLVAAAGRKWLMN